MKKLLIPLIFGILLLFETSFAQQQSNTIEGPLGYISPLNPRQSITKTIEFDPPEGVAEILSAEVMVIGDFPNDTEVYTKVNGQYCYPYRWYVKDDVYGYTITFDCTHNFDGIGNYTIYIRASNNLTNVYAKYKIVYVSNPPGSLSVYGTDYFPGENGTIFIQLFDSNRNPINDAACKVTVYYPDNRSEKFMDDFPMFPLGENGIHYVEFTVPDTLGVYMISVFCSYDGEYYRIHGPSYIELDDGTIRNYTEDVQNIDCLMAQFKNTMYETYIFNSSEIANIDTSKVKGITVSWVGQTNRLSWIQIYNYTSGTWYTLKEIPKKALNLRCEKNRYFSGSYFGNISHFINGTELKVRIYSTSPYSDYYVDYIGVVFHATGKYVFDIRGGGELHVYNISQSINFNINQSFEDMYNYLKYNVTEYLKEINTTVHNNYDLLNNIIIKLDEINTTVHEINNTLVSKWGNLTAQELYDISLQTKIIADYINTTRWGSYIFKNIIDKWGNLTAASLYQISNQTYYVAKYINETRWGDYFASDLFDISNQTYYLVKYINETKLNVSSFELYQISTEIKNLANEINTTTHLIKTITDAILNNQYTYFPEWNVTFVFWNNSYFALWNSTIMNANSNWEKLWNLFNCTEPNEICLYLIDINYTVHNLNTTKIAEAVWNWTDRTLTDYNQSTILSLLYAIRDNQTYYFPRWDSILFFWNNSYFALWNGTIYEINETVHNNLILINQALNKLDYLYQRENCTNYVNETGTKCWYLSLINKTIYDKAITPEEIWSYGNAYSMLEGIANNQTYYFPRWDALFVFWNTSYFAVWNGSIVDLNSNWQKLWNYWNCQYSDNEVCNLLNDINYTLHYLNYTKIAEAVWNYNNSEAIRLLREINTTAHVNNLYLTQILAKWGNYTAYDLYRISEMGYNVSKYINETRWGNYIFKDIIDKWSNLTAENLYNLSNDILEVVRYINETRWGSYIADDLYEISNRAYLVADYINKTRWGNYTAEDLYLLSQSIKTLSEEINLTTHATYDLILLKWGSLTASDIYNLQVLMNQSINEILDKWGNYSASELYAKLIDIELITRYINETRWGNVTAYDLLAKWGNYTAEDLYSVSLDAKTIADYINRTRWGTYTASDLYDISFLAYTVAKYINETRWNNYTAHDLYLISKGILTIVEEINQTTHDTNDFIKNVWGSLTANDLKNYILSTNSTIAEVLSRWGNLTAQDLYDKIEQVYLIADYINTSRWGNVTAYDIISKWSNLTAQDLYLISSDILEIAKYINETRWGLYTAQDLYDISFMTYLVAKYINESRWNNLTTQDLYNLGNMILLLANEINQTTYDTNDFIKGVWGSLTAEDLKNYILSTNSTVAEVLARWGNLTAENLYDKIDEVYLIVDYINSTRWGNLTAQDLIDKWANLTATDLYLISNDILEIVKYINETRWGDYYASDLYEISEMIYNLTLYLNSSKFGNYTIGDLMNISEQINNIVNSILTTVNKYVRLELTTLYRFKAGKKLIVYAVVYDFEGNMVDPSYIKGWLFNSNRTLIFTNDLQKIKTGIYVFSWDIPSPIAPGQYYVLVNATVNNITTERIVTTEIYTGGPYDIYVEVLKPVINSPVRARITVMNRGEIGLDTNITYWVEKDGNKYGETKKVVYIPAGSTWTSLVEVPIPIEPGVYYFWARACFDPYQPCVEGFEAFYIEDIGTLFPINANITKWMFPNVKVEVSPVKIYTEPGKKEYVRARITNLENTSIVVLTNTYLEIVDNKYIMWVDPGETKEFTYVVKVDEPCSARIKDLSFYVRRGTATARQDVKVEVYTICPNGEYPEEAKREISGLYQKLWEMRYTFMTAIAIIGIIVGIVIAKYEKIKDVISRVKFY